ncbi:MAG: hypothetical protein WA814_03235 [Candidatus Baltobacteraceae bacterium]
MQPWESASGPDRAEEHEDGRLARMLFWVGLGVGVAAAGAALAYATIRLVSSGRRDDPTANRIQELIDEANSLLKALDEQRHSA